MKDENSPVNHTTVQISNPGEPNNIGPPEVTATGSVSTSSTSYVSSDNYIPGSSLPGGFPISEVISDQTNSELQPLVQTQFPEYHKHLSDDEHEHPNIKSKTSYHLSYDQDHDSHHYPPPQSYTPKIAQTLFRYKTQQLIPLTEFVC